MEKHNLLDDLAKTDEPSGGRTTDADGLAVRRAAVSALLAALATGDVGKIAQYRQDARRLGRR